MNCEHFTLRTQYLDRKCVIYKKKKTKVIVFKGNCSVITKIVVYSRTVEQISHFQYLGWVASSEKNQYIINKLTVYHAISGKIRKKLKGNERKEMQSSFIK